MNKYKYSAKFDFNVFASTELNNMQISKASLEPLRDMIPDDIDLEKNIDIMAVAFNAAVVNRFNKNGDGINTASAKEIKDLFIHKPCNIEHQKESIVGHIISAGFSEYQGGNNFMEIEDDLKSPFNICLGAIVYKTVVPEFAEALSDSTDESSEGFQSISASWEIGFNEYSIALGSGDIDSMEIISDEIKIEEMSKYLKSFGGPGELEDGTKVSRLIKGDIYPLGIGFTNNPAADVKGVIMKDDETKHAESVDKSNFRDDYNDKEKSSHLNSQHVIQEEQNNFSKTMEKEQLLKDIEQLLSEKAAAKDFSDEAIANITKVFHEAIREKNSEYGEQIEKAKAEQAEAETQKDELSKTLSELQEKLNSTEEKLQGLEDEKIASQTQAAFDARMSYIEEIYELEDEDRKVIASEVSDLSLEEEAFASYQDKLAIVLKSKSKEYLSKLAEEMEGRIQAEVEKRLSEASETVSEETASVESQVEETLDKAEAVETGIPNNNGESIETEESLQDRFVKAFKDSVKVTF